MRPRQEPIGLEVARTGRLLSRAFDDELGAAGGSLPTWLIVTALKKQDNAIQRQIAAAVGIEDATLTHHLHRMEDAGLVTRTRAPENRRTQQVALTPEGDALFAQLFTAVIGFDERLRAGFTDDELVGLRTLLGRLRANLSPGANS